MRKIVCYGDSWTFGVGAEVEPGAPIIDIKTRYTPKYAESALNNSWPAYLQKKVPNFNVVNMGQAGSSNYKIYKNILNQIKSKELKKDDIVIVTWSSIIREPLNFLVQPDKDETDSYNGFLHYSNQSLLMNREGDKPHWIKNITIDFFKNYMEDIHKDFLVNRLDYDFLHKISMNYVINLQIIFKKLGIHYYFINAFENVLTDNDLLKFIEKEKWILYNYTLSDYLADEYERGVIDKNLPYALWQDNTKKVERNNDGPHPNRIGYKLISELIYKNIFSTI